MTALNDWPNISRILWLNGGLIALNKACPTVQVRAGFDGPIYYEFRLQSYGSVFSKLLDVGFSVMGATFIQDMNEIRGIRPPEFRAWIESWRVSDLRQQWRQIAHAASKNNEMALMDVAARISYELMYSEMRLENLCSSYNIQISSRARQQENKDFERFKDLNSPPIYLSIHALFWELAILRDNLAEFAAKFLFKIDGVTTYKGLLKRLPKSKLADNDLAIDLLSAGTDTGWLGIFSAYRNLFTHSAPMEQAAGIAFAVQDKMALPDGRSVPQLYYPLPNNIQELVRRRSGGTLYKSFDELIAASMGKRPLREIEPDALHYLHSTLHQMSLLAERLIKFSPIAPKMIQITDANVIGPIQIIE